MFKALALAAKARPISPPNPSVGCVIVREGSVLGEGFTQKVGSDHAEIQAIKDAASKGHDVKGATVYVTLEPCSHYGRTPPCALRLIKEQVARVVVACLDPNPLVAGRGVEMLRQAGDERRLYDTNDRKSPLGARESRDEPRWIYGSDKWRKSVDHRT